MEDKYFNPFDKSQDQRPIASIAVSTVKVGQPAVTVTQHLIHSICAKIAKNLAESAKQHQRYDF